MDTPITEREAAMVLTPREALAWAVTDARLDRLNKLEPGSMLRGSTIEEAIHARDLEIARLAKFAAEEARTHVRRGVHPFDKGYSLGAAQALEWMASTLEEAE